MFSVDRAQHSSFSLIGDLMQERGLCFVWLSERKSPISHRPIMVFVAHGSKCSLFGANPQLKVVIKIDFRSLG
jgi:hypothetical protein